MSIARIYKPSKTATQSGQAKTHGWKLVFAPEKPYFTDGLMGWTGMSDMTQEIQLSFASLDDAIAYAKSQQILYEVEEPQARHHIKKSYADNFAFAKITG